MKKSKKKIAFICVHNSCRSQIAEALANHFQPKILHTIMHPLFFGVCSMHIAVSVSKAMITLGIGNAKTVKIVDIIIKILCAVIWIASVIGFYRCLFLGVAR